MVDSDSGFVLVPERRTLRRIVAARSTTSNISFSHISRRARTFSWIVFIICCATRTVMAAPVRLSRSEETVTDVEEVHDATSTERFREVRPKWVNPCGGILDEAAADAVSGPPLDDHEVAANAILDVEIALSHIQLFKDEFVRSVFRMSFEDMTTTWARTHYDWLPDFDSVPKVVGAQLSPTQLNSLNLGEMLKKSYLAAQTLAVGMEQVILDRAVYGGGYLEEFAAMENKLSMVLCSLQMALLEKHVQPDSDAARQLMSNEYRDMRTASGRNFRDFIIMRDYINLLEYVQQVLQHFQQQTTSSSTLTTS